MFRIILILSQILFTVHGDYDCLCNYNVETTLYDKPVLGSAVTGYLYEFDCKPAYSGFDENQDVGFQAVQYEQKIAYVQMSSMVSMQICQGSVPETDKVKVLPTTSSSAAPFKPETFQSSTQHKQQSSNRVTKELTMVESSSHTSSHLTTQPVITMTETSSTGVPAGSVASGKSSQSNAGNISTTASTNFKLSQSTMNKTNKFTTSTKPAASTSIPPTLSIPSNQSAAVMSTTLSTTLATPLETKSTEHLSNCESNWVPYEKSCYRFVTDHGRLEWKPANKYDVKGGNDQHPIEGASQESRNRAQSAKKFCNRMNSRLVFIETPEEDRFLDTELRMRIDTDNDDDEKTGVWIGGTDMDRENQWVWRDSLLNINTPISGYTNWYPGEPDSGDHEKEEDCMCLIGNKGFQWQDYRCRDNMYFVCEKPRTSHVGLSLVG